MKKSFIFILSFLILFSFLFFPKHSAMGFFGGGCVPVCVPEWRCKPPGDQCSGEIQFRLKNIGCGPPACTPWKTIKTCTSWQICDDGTLQDILKLQNMGAGEILRETLGDILQDKLQEKGITPIVSLSEALDILQKPSETIQDILEDKGITLENLQDTIMQQKEILLEATMQDILQDMTGQIDMTLQDITMKEIIPKIGLQDILQQEGTTLSSIMTPPQPPDDDNGGMFGGGWWAQQEKTVENIIGIEDFIDIGNIKAMEAIDIESLTNIENKIGIPGIEKLTAIKDIDAMKIEDIEKLVGIDDINIIGGIEGIKNLTSAEGLIGIGGIKDLASAEGLIGIGGIKDIANIGSIESIIGPNGIETLIGIEGIKDDIGLGGIEHILNTENLIGEDGINALIYIENKIGIGNIETLTNIENIIDIGGIKDIVDIKNIVSAEGIQGLVGIPGIEDIIGTEGIQGLVGIPGIEDIIGTEGIQGLIGIPGIEDIIGTEGIQGITNLIDIGGIGDIIGMDGIKGIEGLIGIKDMISIEGITNMVGIGGIKDIIDIGGIGDVINIGGIKDAIGMGGIGDVIGIGGIAEKIGGIPGIGKITSIASTLKAVTGFAFFCRCEGKCLEIPQNPRYFDNPNYPGNLTPEELEERKKDPNNIFLPVKQDWDDILGWKYGSVKREHPWFYKIEMTHTSRGIKDIGKIKVDSEKLNASEYNAREVHDPCFLHSNSVYDWRTRACCFHDKHGCGEWNDPQWKFSTNHAPEPISPYDPDWAGTEYAPDQPLEVELKWCGAEHEDWYYSGDNVVFQREVDEEIKEEKPKSFELKFYLGKDAGENETLIRHPWLDDLAPLTISDFRFPEPKPIFCNKNYKYFTPPPFIYKETELDFYTWEVLACEKFLGRQCTDFSQEWRFSLDQTIEIEIPQQILPLNNIEIPVGLPVTLEWDHILGAKSYILKIDGEEIIHSGAKYVIDHPELQLDTVYQWKVKACRSFKGTECGDWSEEWQFKTTGRPPVLIHPPDNAVDILIPATLQWEAVPGAKSYFLYIKEYNEDGELGAEFGIDTEKPKHSLDFPFIIQNREYDWMVSTCARTMGDKEEICGVWSEKQTFTTIKLTVPINPFPEINKEIYTYQMPKTFSWEPVLGARYYKTIITQPDGKTIEKITSNPSTLINFHYPGNYQWQAQACLDKKCTEAGEIATWNFTLTAKEAPVEHGAGLVPCGRKYDNPNTEWRETDPCQPKHIFILLYSIISFVLWTMIPLILVILVVYTGAMFYFSLSTGTKEVIPKVKALWKSVGIGFGLIFLSWLIVTWILWLFGYQLGPWYYIPL